jgi:hypothetical protein
MKYAVKTPQGKKMARKKGVIERLFIPNNKKFTIEGKIEANTREYIHFFLYSFTKEAIIPQTMPVVTAEIELMTAAVVNPPNKKIRPSEIIKLVIIEA